MKKLISGIMAIAILASAVLCGTTTAFAADTGNSAVGDVDMWNHDFKNKLTGELCGRLTILRIQIRLRLKLI